MDRQQVAIHRQRPEPNQYFIHISNDQSILVHYTTDGASPIAFVILRCRYRHWQVYDIDGWCRLSWQCEQRLVLAHPGPGHIMHSSLSLRICIINSLAWPDEPDCVRTYRQCATHFVSPTILQRAQSSNIPAKICCSYDIFGLTMWFQFHASMPTRLD